MTKKPPFKLGARVTDPTLSDDPTLKDTRYRLNANILPADEQLLKKLSGNRGVLQIVTANLIHAFCESLRKNNITDYTQNHEYNHALASFCGFELADPTAYLKYLPSGTVEWLSTQLRGNAPDSIDRVESRNDDGRGAESVCGKTKGVKKSTSNPKRSSKRGANASD